MEGGELLGKEILLNLDELVDTIALSKVSEGKASSDYQKQGVLIVKKLSKLLTGLIGPNEDYIRQALSEMMLQRLHDHEVAHDYDEICEMLDKLYKTSVQTSNPTCSVDIDPFRRAVRRLFFQFKIVENYRYQGFIFSYYIPSLGLILDKYTGSHDPDIIRKEYICEQKGIKLISIANDKLLCSREIEKEIKRRLSRKRENVLKTSKH